MKQFVVTGMSCAACQVHVEKAVKSVPGVDEVSVSLLTNSMSVEGSADASAIMKAVEQAGYGASEKGSGNTEGAAKEAGELSLNEKLALEEEALKDHESPKLLRRLFWSLGWLLILMYLTMGYHMLHLPMIAVLDHNYLGLGLTQLFLATIVMFINRAFFISGYRSVKQKAPNMDTLVALGSSISWLWSVVVLYKMSLVITHGGSNEALMELYHTQLYFESAAMIPALITVGKTLEAISKGRTTDALKNLMRLAPKRAVVVREGEEVEVSIEEVKLGDLFLVKPGEAIPVDGQVVEGMTTVDEAALTGESIPVDKAVGDLVSAATMNVTGVITAKATRVGEDTTFAQIIHMVSDAAATKAPIARIADRVAAVFVPAVIGIAAVVAVVWLLLGRDVAYALERAIAVLVISCPCALGLATPVAIMVGNGLGARHGILFKTSESLENTGRVQIIALDKTGTITAGKPEVTDVYPAKGVSLEELMRLSVILEERSEHPLAKAVVNYGIEKGFVDTSCHLVSDFQVLPGHGLRGRIGEALVIGGSQSFMEGIASISQDLEEAAKTCSEDGKTPLFFAKDGQLLGMIAVADVMKEDSSQAIQELKNQGIEVVMLTGDNERSAKAIGIEAGVDRVIAGVLPDGKEAVIRSLKERGFVAMVGDGINDAPALKRADIGIAIGAGTDVAIDSADVVLMNSKLTDVAAAIRLSRATLRNIHENLFWAFAYNIILIPMAAGLYSSIQMNPMWGAAAMSISSFTVCMNALRLNLFRLHDASRDRKIRKKGSVLEGMEQENKEAEENSQGINLKKGDQEMKETVKIEGMMCMHCEKAVKTALEAIDGVDEAVVSHESGTAILTLSKEVADETIQAAIEGKDYKFCGIEK
ncbi:MAG: heavy metal translocating P-type ATPase [Lachnospiraceae bacterium]|nr:heavy metal translocating P-type ATPase [Lachnospiraceae bacterium]